MKTKWEFDERQLHIRGEVFFHGFITALVLLLLNAFLHSVNVVWASGFHQNILVMMLISTITGIEAILRGAYFGRGKSRWMVIGVFGLLSLVLIVLNVQHIAQGEVLLESGMLTDNGFSLALVIMFTSITIISIAKELIEKHEKIE